MCMSNYRSDMYDVFWENLKLVLNNYFIYVIICIKVKADHYMKTVY